MGNDTSASVESTKERENFLEEFLGLVLRHLASFKVGTDAQNEEIRTISSLIKQADSLDSLIGIRKKYRELIVQIDGEPQEEKKEKKGGLFGSLFKGPEKKGVEVIDPKDEALKNLEGTVTAFAKGTRLMLDDDHPLVTDMNTLKSGEAGSFTTDHYKKLKNEILTFFVAKSNEAAVIVQERLELKNIIAALASEMSTISVASDSYNDNLSSYAKKLGEADSLTEILDVKQKILNETGEIQKENQKLKNSMKETAALLSASSKKISDLEKELGKARMEMMKDTLTRLYNRRAFDERIEEQLNRFKRYGEGFCLIFMDLDHFKRVNDTYGHVAGDIVLKTVASIAKESIRSMDFIGRYGGEEFVAIIEKTETVSGKKVAEKIRKSIGGHEFIYKNQKVDVQVSLGVTGSRGGDTPQSITERADSALYQAKERGRNQVVSV